MTIPRLRALHRYWRAYPPVHMMIACYFGLGKKQQNKMGDLGDLITMSGKASG